MTTAELINGIVRTRAEMAAATRRDCDAIYRRLLPRHQAAWDELSIPNLAERRRTEAAGAYRKGRRG